MELDDLEKTKEELFTFVWDFKHGNNIVYNIEVLKSLYESRENLANPNILNKPITIQIVAILEATLIDFLTRIDQATTHLPGEIARETLDALKEEIEKDKKPHAIETELGEHIYMRRKMYHLSQIIKMLKKHEIFGDQNDEIYDRLSHFADMRNRIHIENYYGNLEGREQRVFTPARLAELEKTLDALWKKMTTDYKRPWQCILLLAMLPIHT